MSCQAYKTIVCGLFNKAHCMNSDPAKSGHGLKILMTFILLYCRYATEQAREVLGNMSFCILGSLQVPFGARLLCQIDQGHGLIDRFLFVAPCCLRPTPDKSRAAALVISKGPLQHLADVFLKITRLHKNCILRSTQETHKKNTNSSA